MMALDRDSRTRGFDCRALRTPLHPERVATLHIGVNARQSCSLHPASPANQFGSLFDELSAAGDDEVIGAGSDLNRRSECRRV